MGLDIGEKRVGVAVSDPSGRVATPVAVLDASRVSNDGLDLRRLIEEYEVERIVVGLPLSLDGSEGPQAARVRAVAARIRESIPLPVDFADERFSSAEARKRMREAGASDRRQRGSKDMVAAAIFLQTYLDARGSSDSDVESRR